MCKQKKIDLFVMCGQSNMQGCFGDAEGYPEDINNMDRKIKFYWETPGEDSSSNGEWTFMKAQDGRYPKGYFGPEVTFARHLSESSSNLAIFKYSLGATSLKDDWKAPGENGMYDNMLRELKKAVELLEKEDYQVCLRAFVWIQGESDAHGNGMADEYGERLKKLIGHFCKNMTGAQKISIILGVDEQHPRVKEYPQIVEHQQKIAEKIPGIIFTSMIGLEKADVTHLTPVGLIEHGKRLFDAFSIVDKELQN